jgi:hypothetical protein
VLRRRLPWVPGAPRTLAYLPEGPALAASGPPLDPSALLGTLARHERARGAFAVRIGPRVPLRSWSAGTVRDAIGHRTPSLDDVPPDAEHPVGQRWTAALRWAGWRACPGDLGDGQPGYVVTLDLGGRDEAALRAAMNQQWRRNLARAERGGVVVRRAGGDDVARFEELYAETARRHGFTPRPPGYLSGLLATLGDRARLDVAEHDGAVLAGALGVRTGRRLCYLYGGSTARDRDVRAANALHWAVAVRAATEGVVVYDLRGVEPGLREGDRGAGMLRFKAGLGGTAVQYVGEWERVLRPAWFAAYSGYRKAQAHRAGRRRHTGGAR